MKNAPARRVVAAALAAALALVAPACGSGDDAMELTVVGTEMAFDAPASIEPGDYLIRFSNEGAVYHELAVKDASGRVLRRVTAAAGEEASMELTLPAGTYELGCFEPGHYEGGMHQELTVA